ncbi:MAG: STAS domain-containing protein [Negativicutes bacterium]|nr:STAS domain-containing protein [Negativicutes bacterium]
MERQISVTPECVNVKVVGRMSCDDAEMLGQELMSFIAKGHGTYVIDMSDLTYISSAGIGVLIALNKRALRLEGSITVAGMKGHIKELFEMTMMNKLFKITD